MTDLPTPIVRPATAADLADIVELRRRSYKGGRLEDVIGPFVGEHFGELFVSALAATETAWLFVAEVGDRTIGVSFGVVSPVWLSPSALSANEMFVWVEPEYRRQGVGSRLLERVERWASEHGCQFVATFSYPGLMPHAKNALCAARGYQVAETCHLRRL